LDCKFERRRKKGAERMPGLRIHVSKRNKQVSYCSITAKVRQPGDNRRGKKKQLKLDWMSSRRRRRRRRKRVSRIKITK